ncbi:MAG TPA: class I SAM-dependent methyltransferase [Methylomirabilota bacterium]|nr:class I SAM-dependent methyltransferase [Methylomirabilota bacterium]
MKGDEPATGHFGSSRVAAGHLAIVRCRSCGLLMTNPQDDAATLEDIYRSFSDPAYDAEYADRGQEAAERLALVARHHPAPGRLLDVGCGTGAFVCAALERGWEAAGLDSSDWMVTRGRARCPPATFWRGALGVVNFPPQSFDVITMWNVLEHVVAPREALRRVREWLAPGGGVFLSMPNGSSLVSRLMGRRWPLLLREHLWYFGPRTIGRLLADAGFELIEVRSRLVRFSGARVLARLEQDPGEMAGLSRRLSRVNLLCRLTLRVPTGEMDVVARVRS